ncbi:MAG: zinc ribbon domain-containing protein [Promethearchaeia archaeon]
MKKRKTEDPDIIIERAQKKLQDPQSDFNELEMAELRGKVKIAKARKDLNEKKKKLKQKGLDKGDKIMIKTEINKAKANLSQVKDRVKSEIKKAKAIMKRGEGVGLTKELKKSREKWEVDEKEIIEESVEEEAEDSITINKCPNCGWILSSSAQECPKCDWRKDSEEQKGVKIEEKLPKKENYENKLKKKREIEKEISNLQQEVKELDQRFFNKLIEQDPYLNKKNKLYEKIGALQAKKESLEE